VLALWTSKRHSFRTSHKAGRKQRGGHFLEDQPHLYQQLKVVGIQNILKQAGFHNRLEQCVGIKELILAFANPKAQSYHFTTELQDVGLAHQVRRGRLGLQGRYHQRRTRTHTSV